VGSEGLLAPESARDLLGLRVVLLFRGAQFQQALRIVAVENVTHRREWRAAVPPG